MKRLKELKLGCDNCGENKPVKKWKGGGASNWQHIYLCIDCWPKGIEYEEVTKLVI